MIKKLIKISTIIIISIVLVLGGIITVLVNTVDQNLIKNKAAELVYNKTGRELKINGEINWTFFPWLGIKLQKVQLSNPASSSHDYFAKADELAVNIKLIPLLLRKIEIGTLALKALDLKLIKNSVGLGNWQDLILSQKTIEQPNNNPQGKFNLSQLSINSITVIDGKISFLDQKNNQQIKVNGFDLSCKNINFSHPFEIDLSFNLDRPTSELAGRIIISTEAKLDFNHDQYEFKNIRLGGKLQNKISKKEFNLSGKTNLSFDQKNQTLLIKNLNCELANTVITGSIQGTKVIDAPNFSGNLVINNSDIQPLIQLLGFNQYLKKEVPGSFQMKLNLSNSNIQIEPIEARLADMILKGNTTYAANKINFDFELNKINGEIFTTSSNVSNNKKSAQKENHYTKVDPNQPSFLRANQINGNLKIASINYNKLKLTNFNTRISNNRESINCQNMQFDFYRGKGMGDATISIHGDKPNINLRLSLKSVPIQMLLAETANYEKLSGTLDLTTSINLNTLNGDGRTIISHGSYQGIDIPYEVRRAHAMINGKPQPEKPKENRTQFDQLTMGFKMNNGVINTNDLLVQSPDYKITGQGSANLTTQNLDLALSAYSTHDQNFFLPVKITGSFGNPSVRFDTAVMLQHVVKKVIQDVVKEQVEKHLENLPQGLKNLLPF